MKNHTSSFSRIPYLVAVFSAVGTIAASALDVPLTGDSWTGKYSTYAGVQKGADVTAWVAGLTSSTHWNKRTWLRFDLAAAIPAGTTWDQVSKATLRVYANLVTTAGPVEVWAASAAWQENTLTHNNSAAVLGDPGNGNAAYATQTIGTVDKYYTFDVTELVRDWLNVGAPVLPNYGIVLVAGNAITNIQIDTKEASQKSHPASLHIALTGARLNPRGDLSMGQFTHGAQP